MSQALPIQLGQFRPGSSYLHQLDARAKIIALLFLLSAVLLSDSYWFPLIVFSTMIAGLVVAEIQPKSLWKNVRPVIMLAGFTFLFHLFFTGRDNPDLLDYGLLKISKAGVELGLFYGLRLVVLLSISFVLTLSTSAEDLTDGLARLAHPLRKLRLPVDDLALIVFIAIRFIPVLYDEFHAIRNAQLLRGARFDGNLRTRIRRLVSLIVPMLIAAIQRADDLSMAISVRGYGLRYQGQLIPRTYYTTGSFGFKETLFLILLLLISGLLLWGLG